MFILGVIIWPPNIENMDLALFHSAYKREKEMEGGGVNSDSFESWKANEWQFGSLEKAKIKF